MELGEEHRIVSINRKSFHNSIPFHDKNQQDEKRTSSASQKDI
jgi:hypothetical protein